MNAERWKRIEEVYHSALASPRAGRAALLDELCSGDCDMRREVESLLEAREQAGSFLSASHSQGHIAELVPEQSLVGQTLGHYDILSAIGAGAMGEVYLARDTRLDRQVALKVLPARFTRSSGRMARFRREAKAASALNHPNIITIYDIGQIGDTWFIAAELIQGVTLRERLAAGRMELQEVLGIALQCARGLEAAHQAGIVHRDIKPENIMVRPDGLVKVVDFGLARVNGAGRESAADASRAGALIGTPRYMSPEQARVQKLDPRTDIFSLGAVLYEMTTGEPAFLGGPRRKCLRRCSAQCPARRRNAPKAFRRRWMRSLRKPSKKTAKAAIKPCRFAAYLRDLQQRPEPSSEAVAYKKRATERAGSTRPPAASRHPDYRDYGDSVNRRPGAGLVCVDH